MEGYKFGGSESPRGSQDMLSSSSSRLFRHQQHTSTSSARRASLPSNVYPSSPSAVHPYFSSPRNSIYRHRPSISSTTTTTSASTNTSASYDAIPVHFQENHELAGIYKDLHTYVFGITSPQSTQRPTASSPPLASSSRLGQNHRNHSGTLSISGASTGSHSGTNYMGITVGSVMGTPTRAEGADYYEDSANSDAGSAYSPDNDNLDPSPSSFKRDSWQTRSPSLLPNSGSSDAMDIDSAQHTPSSRRDSRPKLSSRREEKKRDRGDKDEQGAVTDEDDSARRNERGKMRAIDDGTRRPSLPINMPPTLSSGRRTSTGGGTSGSSLDRDEPMRSPSPNPRTPTAATFSGASSQTPISLNTSTIERSTSSHSPVTYSSSSHHHKTRPRSRSTRASKPVATAFPPPPIINPDWNPNWANENADPNNSSKLLNPVVPFSPTSVNPFTARGRYNRSRSQTVTQTQVTTGDRSGQHRPTESESNALPSATPPPLPLSSSSLVAKTPDGKVSIPITPPPDSDVVPEKDGQAATADFDLAFIFAGAVNVNGANTGRKASLAPSLAPSLEDTFVKFVNKFDDEYGERRDKWSYRMERDGSVLPPVPGSEGSYWSCTNMGRYWVGKEGVNGVGDDILHHVGASSVDGFTPDNSIVIRFCPPKSESSHSVKPSTSSNESNKRSKSFSPPPAGLDDDSSTHSHGDSLAHSHSSHTIADRHTIPSHRRSNVRIQVKKDVRAPAFTLYLGPRMPRSLGISRPTIMLAPKAHHLQASAPPKSRAIPPIRPRGNSVHAYGIDGDEVLPSSSGVAKRSNGVLSSPLQPGGTLDRSLDSSKARSMSPSLGANGSPSISRQKQVLSPIDSRSSAPPANTLPSFPSLPQSPPAVSLDLMSVAAATGRMTSAHNHAFDTLSPEDGRVILEHLKQRSSIGLRLKRAFGGINGGSKESGMISQNSSHSSSHVEVFGSISIGSGKDVVLGTNGRSGSPPTLGKHSKDKDKDHHAAIAQATPLEGAFEPPWMLMTPMYVKEAVFAAERSMYTGFASLGLAAPTGNKKNRRHQHQLQHQHQISSASSTIPSLSPTARRNSILETIPHEAMCMVLPLWDLTLDLEEERRKRRGVVDDLDLDLDDLEEEEDDDDEDEDMLDGEPKTRAEWEALERKKLAKEMARRRKMHPPPKMERKYLLTYYVPFNSKKPHALPPSSNQASSSVSSKKRPEGQHSSSSRSTSGHHSRRASGIHHPTEKLAVRSFRVVARILSPAELRDSGLSPPSNITDPKRMQQQSTSYYSSALNYSRMDRRLSSASIFGDALPSAFSAVIAVCHDRRRGIEFVPEGLDSLGLCGGETMMSASGGTMEKLPPLFPPAHLVPVAERHTPPLNAVGKQIVEMIWAGCLALTELGV